MTMAQGKGYCTFEDCHKKHDSHGLCANHARQLRKYGHPLSKEEKHKHLSDSAKLHKNNLGKIRTKESLLKHSIKTRGRTLNTGKTHFKKGMTPWNKDKVSIMPTPWNKGKKGVMPAAWNKGTKGLMPRPWNKIGDGITSQNKIDRTLFQKNFQPLVFKRDNFTCQVCQQYGGNLQVDHIKGWSKYPELRFDLDNCRTLCMACHYYVTFKRKMPEGIVWGHNLNRRIVS